MKRVKDTIFLQKNFRGFLESFSLVFDVGNLYRVAIDEILSCLFYFELKATERCDFVCNLGWKKHAVNYVLLFG